MPKILPDPFIIIYTKMRTKKSEKLDEKDKEVCWTWTRKYRATAQIVCKKHFSKLNSAANSKIKKLIIV